MTGEQIGLIRRESRHIKGNRYCLEGFSEGSKTEGSKTLEGMVVCRAPGRDIWYNLQKRKVMK